MVSVANKKKTPINRTHHVKEIKNELQQLLDVCESAEAVLAVTSDGHLICQYSRNKYPLKRLATMSSTLMSLGDTITDELSMGRCQNIISENEEGIVLFTHISIDTVLVALTTERGSLGMLLSSCRSCVKRLNLENFNPTLL